MLKGFVVVFTALFTVFLLKKPLNKQRTIGVILVFLGITIVGLANILYVKESSKAKNPMAGLVIMILSQVSSGM